MTNRISIGTRPIRPPFDLPARICTSAFAIGCAFSGTAPAPAADARPAPGLAVTLTAADGKATDTTISPNVWLHVEAGKPPTPFLAEGRFTVVWQGFVSADLRGDFSFEAALNGSLKLEINGTTALEAVGSGGVFPLSKAVRLNKGTNGLKATFRSPEQGDAFVRLSWTEKPPFTSPLPLTALTHASSAELASAAEQRLGRELFLELRCSKCHTDAHPGENGVPELAMDAPALEGIGARRQYDWMARWILDPKSLRASATMPRLLTGPTAREDSEAMAAYLASLKSGGEVEIRPIAYQTRQNAPPDAEISAPGGAPKPLYERLHCLGCHNPPDATDPDPAKLSQKHLAEKFSRGQLAEFLRAPEAHYAWTRMPSFHLSDAEARELADWLFAATPKAELKTAPTNSAVIEKGKRRVQTSGCLNCHGLNLENKARTLALPRGGLSKGTEKPDRDCLGAKPFADYQFSAGEKAALTAFATAGFASLSRHVPAEFAERQTRLLNCAACHGQLDGVPPLEQLGGRLQPAWAARFIAGEIPHKMRYDFHPKGEPWMAARMPAFKSRARALAVGLAQQHGYPKKSPPEPPVDTALAKIGHQLIGKDGGFSCVSCHAVGPRLAREVFESEGINFADSADRLLPDYYRRWFLNPLSIDPQTKMPAYFDEGRSPFTEILGGDALKQIDAVWEYLKQRDQMPPPQTGAE